MRTLWQSSVFHRMALVLLAALLLGIAMVATVVLPAQAQTQPWNLSQGKPVTCSSVENAGTPCANAVDGNTGTRWSSAFSDPQWIQVDLGANYLVTSVVLNWETASGKAFRIDISYDATDWRTLYSTTSGTGGTQTITTHSDGRYVRMYGTERNTQWGYSLWEFQVYGLGSTASDTPPTLGTLTLTTPPPTWTPTTPPPPLGTLRTPTLTPTMPTPTENLALNHPVFCSSIEHAGVPCEAAVDGSESTRWGSAFSDPQWIYVDLGANYTVSRVVLNWETAYGRGYRIQISTDANDWRDMYFSYNVGNGGIDDLTVSGFGRYIRMYGTVRGTEWGYSLWEFEVYGSIGPTLPDLVIANISTRYDPDVNCYTSQIPIAKPILGIDVAFVNASNADAGPFVVGYQNINTGATAQQSVPGLAAGQRGTLFFPDRIYYTQGAWITLDPLNQVAEADENNNISGYQVPPEGTPLPACTPTPTPTPTTPPPITNVALNKPVTYSNQQAGNEASHAVDGSTATRWAGSPWPQWIEVDLGDLYFISRTELMPYMNRAYQYRIETSTTGTSYFTVVDKTANTTGGAMLTDTFARAAARYVRLTVTGASGYTGGWVSLYEFRVFGIPVPPTPPPSG